MDFVRSRGDHILEQGLYCIKSEVLYSYLGRDVLD
jgi:hypothetical protein